MRRIVRLQAVTIAGLIAGALGPAAGGSTRTARAEDAPPAVAAATGDVLVLKDGRRLDGRVVAETDDAVTFRSGATTRMYARTDVERIDRDQASAPSAGADARGAPPAGAQPSAPTPDGRKDKAAFGKKGRVLTDAARQWVRDLARSAETEDEQVRRSVAAALRALGPAAVPSIVESASAAASPGAKEFLGRVAAEMSGGRKAGAAPPGASAPTAGEDPGMNGPPPEPPEGAPPKGPGSTPPEGRRPGRTMLDRLVADLELREEQRPGMAELLGGLERSQFGLFREMKQGSVAPDQVTPRIDTLRKETLDTAKAILDVAQFDLFEEHARRYFDGLLLRAARGEGRPAAPPAPPPAPKSGE